MKKLIIFLLISSVFSNFGKEVDIEKIEQVKIGNFALPTSQQPGPLIGFGQNILDEGDLQLFAYIDYLKGRNKKFSEIAPSILYAIRDNLSIFVETSVALKFKDNNESSHGIEDSLIQFEYAFYTKDTLTTSDVLTAVANITIPTGSAFKTPPTGFGAPSFFLAFTASHTATDWYYFTSSGAILTTSHKNTKFGNEFLYQFGISKNIKYKSEKWIFNWMVELDGTYRQQSKILGTIDENTGGNQIILGPSLWFSTQQLILQAGISGVILQHLFGSQNKDTYYAAINISWKFN